MAVFIIMRVYKSTRENGYCESRILQILLSQFDSGRGLQQKKTGCFIRLKKVCFDLFLGSSVGRAVDC